MQGNLSAGELTSDQVDNIVRRSYQYVAMFNVIQKFALDHSSGALFMDGFNNPIADRRTVACACKSLSCF